jgi:hypothetical protein
MVPIRRDEGAILTGKENGRRGEPGWGHVASTQDKACQLKNFRSNSAAADGKAVEIPGAAKQSHDTV